MRSKQPIQSNKPTSSPSFLRNVLVGMVFFEPMSNQKINQRIQQSENTHKEALISHERSQNAIAATNDLLDKLKY